MSEHMRPRVWCIVSNSELIEHIAILGDMFRKEQCEVVYVASELPSHFPLNLSKALEVIIGFDTGASEIIKLSPESVVDVQNTDIVIPQTPYLDDHLPQWMLRTFAQARWLCSPYGYTVRQGDEIASVMDERFSMYFTQSGNYFTASQLSVLRDRGAHVVSVGHPSMHRLYKNQLADIATKRVGADKPIVAMQFHWTQEFCSLNLSIELLKHCAYWMSENYQSPLVIESHSLLGLFDGYHPPPGYLVAEVGSVRDEIENLLDEGVIVPSSADFLTLAGAVDVVIADGQSMIAFAAAAGAAVLVPRIANARDLNPEINSLPNVARHDPTDVPTSLELISSLVVRLRRLQPRPTYFQALGLVIDKNPVQVLLSRL